MTAEFKDERGESLISGLLLIGSVLVPLLFIIVALSRIETAHLQVSQTARNAVRAAAQAPDLPHAQAAAAGTARTQHDDSTTTISVTLSGEFTRGATLQADARKHVSAISIPGLGSIGAITVHARARAPIDQYRSLHP
jgi:hypothetical protein